MREVKGDAGTYPARMLLLLLPMCVSVTVEPAYRANVSQSEQVSRVRARLSRMHVTEGVSESVPPPLPVLPVQSKCSNSSANYEHVHCTTATATTASQHGRTA